MFGRRRDALTAQRLVSAQQLGGRTLHVVAVQGWFRGPKAWIRFEGDVVTRDAWLAGCRVRAGQAIVALVTVGWGPHTGLDGVVYTQRIDAILTRRDVRRAARHAHRRARDGPVPNTRRRPRLVGAYDE